LEEFKIIENETPSKKTSKNTFIIKEIKKLDIPIDEEKERINIIIIGHVDAGKYNFI
jgi:hypothetical protein